MDRARWVSGVLLCSLVSVASQASPPPPADSSLIVRGDKALAAGDSISAIGFYRDAVTRSPRDARPYAALGRAYLQVREPAHAREALEAGQRNTRGSEALVLGLAEAYEQLGERARALAVLRDLIGQGNGSRAVFELLASLAERAGAFTEALAARRRLVALLSAEEPGDVAALRLAQTRVAALRLLLGATDRAGPSQCASRTGSIVLQQLLDCPPPPATDAKDRAQKN